MQQLFFHHGPQRGQVRSGAQRLIDELVKTLVKAQGKAN